MCGNARSELRNVALEIGANEIAPEGEGASLEMESDINARDAEEDDCGIDSLMQHCARMLGVLIQGCLISLATATKLVLNLFLGRSAYLSRVLFERCERNPVAQSLSNQYREPRRIRCVEMS